MGKSLPFPAHKHPPRLAGIIAKAGSAASQATAAAGEDQGTAGNGAPTESAETETGPDKPAG